VPTDLRIYSPINDVLHPDDIITFVVARLHIPPKGTILLDVIRIVSGPHETLHNGSTAFSMALTEYVHDANQQSHVQYVDMAI